MEETRKTCSSEGKPKSKSRTPPTPPPPPVELRNWLDLPRDVTASILSRLGAVEILKSAELVCMAWRNVCKDPLTWRTVDMSNNRGFNLWASDLDKMCRRAVDRSCGNLVDINIQHKCTDDLLMYITNSSKGIKRLQLDNCFNITNEGLSEVASKLPLLEELEISNSLLSHEPALQVVGASCPRLKSFKFNHRWRYSWDWRESNDDALAIAATMHDLHHLQLRGNKLTNDGLQAILDGCPHLESLDLRECFHLKLGGELGRRCAERIKKLQLPHEPISKDES
ncbi:putative F-box/LRR-repeat protein 23 [Prunus avium]|uniref:F-box/LRR-repeat protein 23 n=1 Tax=Prunus avium TaxID=42229 RepID=A0A6P5SEZ2_PRUAV|nr:putative F-box/LRR-repeat protein 23 [Prunus avium]